MQKIQGLSEALLEIVANEEKWRPYTDSELMTLVIQNYGVKCDRSCLALRRKELNILASHRRKIPLTKAVDEKGEIPSS